MSIIKSQEIWSQIQSGSISYRLKRRYCFSNVFWGILQIGMFVVVTSFLTTRVLPPILNEEERLLVYIVILPIGALIAFAYLGMAWTNLVSLRHYWSHEIELTNSHLAMTRRGSAVFEVDLQDNPKILSGYVGTKVKGSGHTLYLPVELPDHEVLRDVIVCLSQSRSGLSHLASGAYTFTRFRYPKFLEGMRWATKLFWTRANHPYSAYYADTNMKVDNNTIEVQTGGDTLSVSWDDISAYAFDEEEPYHLALIDLADRQIFDFYTGDFEGSSFYFAAQAELRGLSIQPGAVEYRPSPALLEAESAATASEEQIAQLWQTWIVPMHIITLLGGLAWLAVDDDQASQVLGLNLMLLVIAMHLNSSLVARWKKHRWSIHLGAILLTVFVSLFNPIGGFVLATVYLMSLGMMKLLVRK